MIRMDFKRLLIIIRLLVVPFEKSVAGGGDARGTSNEY